MGIFDDMLGYGELALGGITAFGAAYFTAQAVASGGGAIATSIPLAVTAGGSLLLLDGLDRSGVWEWKKKYNLNWDDVMYGYVIGGTECLAGAYLVYLSIKDLSASTEQYTSYKGLGYAVGIVFGAGGAYLIYDGYRRIKPVLTGHITRVEQGDLKDPADPNLPTVKTLRFYFDDPDNDNKPSYMRGENYRQQCESYSGAKWIEGKLVLGTDTSADEGICVDDSTYSRYMAAVKAKEDAINKGADKVGDDISKEQDKKNQHLREVFNKPIKELTCADWIEINAVPNSWSEKAKTDFYSRNPRDCRIANESNQGLDFRPGDSLDEQHYLDSTHWYVKDWSFLGWLRYQIQGGGAGTGALRDYNYNSKKINAEQMRTLVPGWDTAEPVDTNKSLSELGYSEELLKDRFQGRARDPYAEKYNRIRDVDNERKKDKSKQNYKIAMSRYASGNKPAKVSVSVQNN